MSSSIFSSPSALLNRPNPNPTTAIPPTHKPTPAVSTSTHSLLLHTLGRRNALLLGVLPFLPPPLAAADDEAVDRCSLTVSPSGLAFCDRKVGTGDAAMKGQLIKAHYTGRLESGTVFDSSYKRGKPLTFRVGVGEVIKGWDQGILGADGIPPMLAGGKRMLRLPPELGYGSRGAGCRGGQCIIPPDSTLLFEIEFIG